MRVEAGKAPKSTRIWLDDIEQHRVLWADDEIGELERAKLDERGMLTKDATGERIATEVMRGQVRIER